MKGLKVSDFIVPMSARDTYPTNLDIFGKGGIHSVDAISNRDAITTERRSEGMLSFTKNNESMYALLGGITNDKWFKLFDFLNNTVNFNIACDPNYVLLGNKDGVAKPSPRLRDMQFDIIDLRRRIDKIGILENLDYEHLWIGDYTNRPIQKINIAVKNLPILGAALFPIPLLDVSIPIPNPNFDPTSGWDYVMSSPWLNQIYAGSPNLLNTSTETKISSSLAFAQIKAAQAIKRLDNAGFIVKNKTISYSWENPVYSFVTDPLLIAAMELYGLGTTYTFTKAQALDELGAGLLKNSAEGVLSLGVSGKDYVDVAVPIANMQIALIRPLAQDGQGNDISKLLTRVSKLPEDNMPDLTFIMQRPNAKIPSAQGLSDLAGGILKSAVLTGVISIASGGGTPLIDDYVDPFTLQTEITETKAFATAEAAAAEAAAIASGIAYFTAQMLPYSLIPIVPVGTSISGAIAVAAAAAASAQSSANTANSRIDNLSVAGDVIGTNMGSDVIVTVFTPNPTFTGTEYIRIPTGNSTQRPSNSSVGMVRYNTEL